MIWKRIYIQVFFMSAVAFTQWNRYSFNWFWSANLISKVRILPVSIYMFVIGWLWWTLLYCLKASSIGYSSHIDFWDSRCKWIEPTTIFFLLINGGPVSFLKSLKQKFSGVLRQEISALYTLEIRKPWILLWGYLQVKSCSSDWKLYSYQAESIFEFSSL